MLKGSSQPNVFLTRGKVIVAYIPFLVLLIGLMPHTGHNYDTSCWIKWATNIYENGFGHTYRSGTNYLFVYQYILLLFTKFQGSVESITANIYQLKIITLCFELGTTLILFRILNDKWKIRHKAIQYSLYYFLNIAVLYNSLIWGQIDGIMTFFMITSLYMAYRKKIFWSLFLFYLALNTKFQAIVIMPILILLLLPLLQERINLKKTAYTLGFMIVFSVIAYLPFILAGDLKLLWQLTFGGIIGHSPFVSANGYNFWHYVLRENPYTVPDTLTFAGLTYRMWGIILFSITACMALFPFLKKVFLQLFKNDKIPFPAEKVLICSALLLLLFFFFNTEMFDRFPHPVLIILAIYAILYRKGLPYIMVSLTYVLNLDAVLKFFSTNLYHTFIYNPLFIASVYLATIILLFFDLYRNNKCEAASLIKGKRFSHLRTAI